MGSWGKGWLAPREPWTIEQGLHVGLAIVAVMGWAIAYTALTRGADTPYELASQSVRTELSANLTPQKVNLSPGALAAR
jgi:hypothetical protein